MDFSRKVEINNNQYNMVDLNLLPSHILEKINKLPYSMRVLVENVCRNTYIGDDSLSLFLKWVDNGGKNPTEISFYPARVLMQDFTGVPAIVDLAAMRDVSNKPEDINPAIPVDLVIDHSVIIDYSGSSNALKLNTDLEYGRNLERYKFLKWGQENFDNFKVVPPGVGICHQVNIEYLAKTVFCSGNYEINYLYPDTVVGTDSHTTMVNALSVLGWGVGGIEAESALLGEPISMLLPEVVGVKITGNLNPGVTSTDLVLRIVKELRELGVVEKFVEFYGSGLTNLSLADRATISNMAPEYGATCGYFPTDEETIKYLKVTGRSEQEIAIVDAYSKINGFWNTGEDKIYTDILEIDLKNIKPAISGPKKPHEYISLEESSSLLMQTLKKDYEADLETEHNVENEKYTIRSGDILIASITSCTNTSNPDLLIAAGLIAKKANLYGIQPKKWVKTSLAPGSQVVTEYLTNSGLQKELDAIGFHTVGYGCTTCIGNSGPLNHNISKTVQENDLTCAAILSGNRNFEGRINPDIKTNFLASPPLVVMYSLLGNITKDIYKEEFGKDEKGNSIYFKDLWPSQEEIDSIKNYYLSPELFANKYKDIYKGDLNWQSIEIPKSAKYVWDEESTYIKCPPYFKSTEDKLRKINAVPLAIFGDMVTTDHISPAGSFKKDTPAGLYLSERGVEPKDFNSYGSRRGNHEVMMRGTFANIRIKNEMLENVSGGFTLADEKQMSIFDAAEYYKSLNKDSIIVAGKLYGAGSSRDWAAKGTSLLGIKAVLAESYERIHRSNLVGMGVIPLEFKGDDDRHSLEIQSVEEILINIHENLSPLEEVFVTLNYKNGVQKVIPATFKVYTDTEMLYLKSGGVLNYVLNRINNK